MLKESRSEADLPRSCFSKAGASPNIADKWLLMNYIKPSSTSRRGFVMWTNDYTHHKQKLPQGRKVAPCRKHLKSKTPACLTQSGRVNLQS